MNLETFFYDYEMFANIRDVHRAENVYILS